VIEYFTALVISYTVQDHEIDTTVWFESEKHCASAMSGGSADGIYNHLYDLYGNDIMMTCEASDKVSKYIRPRLRPEKEGTDG
jgi:hypothetical protein